MIVQVSRIFCKPIYLVKPLYVIIIITLDILITCKLFCHTCKILEYTTHLRVEYWNILHIYVQNTGIYYTFACRILEYTKHILIEYWNILCSMHLCVEYWNILHIYMQNTEIFYNTRIYYTYTCIMYCTVYMYYVTHVHIM